MIYKQNCSLFVKIEFITISICLLIQIYIYAWPADHMQDMVSHIFVLNNKIKES